jgi:hypothetical protein
VPHATREGALSRDRLRSPFFRLLNGRWRFRWVKSPQAVEVARGVAMVERDKNHPSVVFSPPRSTASPSVYGRRRRGGKAPAAIPGGSPARRSSRRR